MTPTRMLACLALLACLLTGGCGIKPGELEPPPGAGDTGFPHDYPAGA